MNKIMRNKPLLGDMMSSLYYLYSIGLIQWENVKFNLENAYNVYKIELDEDKMICYQTNIKTTIWI